MKHFGIVLFFFAAICIAGAQADSPAISETNSATRALSLQDCIQQALTHNLDVQIERYTPKISLYDLDAAYGGWDPVFTASGQHNYNVTGGGLDQNQLPIPPARSDQNSFRSGLAGSTPWGMTYNLSGNIADKYGATATPFENSAGAVSASVTQPLLRNFWIDNTRLTIRVAKNRLKYSEQGLRQQIINTVTAVANAYYELVYARENVKVQQEALELAKTQLNQDKQRSQIGTIAELDVQQDEAQAAQSQANLIAAEDTLSVDENTLKNLLTDDYKKWHDVDVQPSETLAATMESFNLQDSWNKGMSERPDLLQTRLNVEQQGIQLKFYRNQLFPELDLIGTYGFNGTGTEFSDAFGQIHEANRPFYTYGAQLSMPLGNFGPRNRLKTSKATLQQVLLQLKQFEQNVMVEIDNAVKNAQSKYQSVEATKQARIYAEAALDAEQKKYAVGKSTTFTVLQLQNNLTAARSQEIRALADYNEALANLAAQEGSTLEKNGIDIAAK
ncbi:MAG TPA: TolC family protein [Methylomirabilota bacterium]|nr:TolC family protein [Methylomirabilota bacterium]